MLDVMKILPVVAQFVHADGRTNMTKLIVTFCNFVEAHKFVLCIEIVAVFSEIQMQCVNRT